MEGMDLWYVAVWIPGGEFRGVTMQKTSAEAGRFTLRWLRNRGKQGGVLMFEPTRMMTPLAKDHWRDFCDDGMAAFTRAGLGLSEVVS